MRFQCPLKKGRLKSARLRMHQYPLKNADFSAFFFAIRQTLCSSACISICSNAEIYVSGQAQTPYFRLGSISLVSLRVLKTAQTFIVTPDLSYYYYYFYYYYSSTFFKTSYLKKYKCYTRDICTNCSAPSAKMFGITFPVILSKMTSLIIFIIIYSKCFFSYSF